VDPEVFHNMFNDCENFYEGSTQGSPAVYVVRLEREELIAAFGKVTSFLQPCPLMLWTQNHMSAEYWVIGAEIAVPAECLISLELLCSLHMTYCSSA